MARMKLKNSTKEDEVEILADVETPTIPKVKKLAVDPTPKGDEPKKDPTPKEDTIAAHWVELVEGSSYSVKGKTFYKNRPVVETEAKILKVVLLNSRFKCTCAERRKA